MGDPTLLDGGTLIQEFGFVQSGASRGTEITSSIGSKSSWQAIGSGALIFGGKGITTYIMPDSFNNQLVDIGYGPTSSNVVTLLPNLFNQNAHDDDADCYGVYWPLPIPRGNFIFARSQEDNSGSPRIAVVVHAGGKMVTSPYTRMVDWGVNLSTSQGTVIPGNATADQWGQWTVVSPAAELDVEMVYLTFNQTNDNTVLSSGSHAFQVGVGAPGSEVAIFHNPSIVADATKDTLHGAKVWQLPLSISKGARVSLRLLSSFTATPDRDLQAVAYGVG